MKKLTNEEFVERFYARVKPMPSGCWEWTGTLNVAGYGQLPVNRRTTAAHRVAYQLMVGAIPDGLTLDHLCRNRVCVNPAHLEPVTRAVNTMRSNAMGPQYAARTHCKNGHEYSADNHYVCAKTGRRRCRICISKWSKEAWHGLKSKEREATC